MNATTIHTTTDNFEATVAELLASIDPNHAPVATENVLCADGTLASAPVSMSRAFCKPRVETSRRASFVSLLGEEVL